MANSPSSNTKVLPVFIHARSLPGEAEKNYTVSDICGACEKRTGYGTILGAQKLGVWRIYPNTEDSRTKLLLQGIVLRGVRVNVCDKNPLIVSSRDGDREIETTRLTIGNIPLSFSNEEILDALKKLGVKSRSALFMERDRDHSGALTRWLTGRRFIYMETPEQPLPKRVEMGPFKATLFHFEQKEAQKQATPECKKCLQPGHLAKDCENEIVCLSCKKPGHKKGSPQCDLMQSKEDEAAASPAAESYSDASLNTQDEDELLEDDASIKSATMEDHTEQPDRGRPRSPQSMAFSEVRPRSGTPGSRKRQKSPTASDSPGKLSKKDNQQKSTSTKDAGKNKGSPDLKDEENPGSSKNSQSAAEPPS